jgi:hypothetical protein
MGGNQGHGQLVIIVLKGVAHTAGAWVEMVGCAAPQLLSEPLTQGSPGANCLALAAWPRPHAGSLKLHVCLCVAAAGRWWRRMDRLANEQQKMCGKRVGVWRGRGWTLASLVLCWVTDDQPTRGLPDGFVPLLASLAVGVFDSQSSCVSSSKQVQSIKVAKHQPHCVKLQFGCCWQGCWRQVGRLAACCE